MKGPLWWDFMQDACLTNTVAQDWGIGAWADSGGYMAARVLQAIRKGEYL